MPWHQPWTQKRQTTLKAMDAWRHHCTAPSLIALDLTHLKYPSHQWSCWNGLPSSSWGRVVVLPAACLLDPSTACTLSQWQIMSTQVRQQDGAQPPSSNNPAGLLPNPGKWAMVLGPNRPKVGQADLTKSPGRDLPFGAIFLILMDQYPRDRAGWRERFGRSPFLIVWSGVRRLPKGGDILGVVEVHMEEELKPWLLL
jgi:hypothetical protein